MWRFENTRLVSAVRQLHSGGVVLVDQTTEQVASPEVKAGPTGSAEPAGTPRWIHELDPTVRTLCVVAGDVVARHRLEVALAEDEEVIDALASHGPHPSLRVGVGSR